MGFNKRCNPRLPPLSPVFDTSISRVPIFSGRRKLEYDLKTPLQTRSIPGILRSDKYPIPIKAIVFDRQPNLKRSDEFPRNRVWYPAPINISEIVLQHPPTWFHIVEQEPSNELKRRLHWYIMAVVRTICSQHIFSVCIVRAGDIWVQRGNPESHLLPNGCRRLDLMSLRPPPRTIWLMQVCKIVLTHAAHPRLPSPSSKVLATIASYEGVPPQEVAYNMLPDGLANVLRENSSCLRGIRVVNGWMVFRSWFMSHATEWKIPSIEIVCLARQLFTVVHDKPPWSAIGRLWTFCQHHGIIAPHDLKFHEFVHSELQKHGINYTPSDLLQDASIDLIPLINGSTNEMPQKRKIDEDVSFYTKKPRVH